MGQPRPAPLNNLVYLVEALEVEGRLSFGIGGDERRKADRGQVTHRHLGIEMNITQCVRGAAHEKMGDVEKFRVDMFCTK